MANTVARNVRNVKSVVNNAVKRVQQATQSVQQGIANSYSLIEFARSHGRMQVTGLLTNKETGEEFRSCAFTSPTGAVTFVGFSSNLGELTPQEIAEQKDELQVVELESGSFKLCRRGSGSWETVDLGL